MAADLGAEVVDDLAVAVPQADIVCTATMTAEPLIEGRWLRPGAHLDLVGAFLPDHREVDDEAVLRAQLYVDTREVTTVEDGDLAIPWPPARSPSATSGPTCTSSAAATCPSTENRTRSRCSRTAAAVTSI